MAPVPARVTVVFEEHLGHRTHAANLRSTLATRADVAVSWTTVEYAPTRLWWEHIPSEPIRVALRGRREVASAFRGPLPDAAVFNTQVPAAIGPRRSRRAPYVLCSDVTPVQLDEMAREYEHRLDRTGVVRWAKYRRNRRVLRRAAAHAPWSRWVADSLVADYGVEPERIEIIPPGIDTTLWVPTEPPPGPVRILFVGGDFWRKGGDVLLDAFATLPPGTAELRLVTQERPPRQPGVTVYNGLTPNGPQLRELFRTSDVFALPSRSETFGIAAIEAGAAALPVVVATVGGLADLVVDGVTGLAVRPGHRDDLATALARLVADGELRRRLGRAARARVEAEFDLRRNTDRLVDLALRCVR